MNNIVVTTNGCFDGLHAGHFFFLGYCLAQGSTLIVGINSDEYIIKHKRPNPIPQDIRKQELLNIGCISKIVIFNEDNPIEFLKQEKPQIHCIGKEYEGIAIEEPYCNNNGIKLIYIPRLMKYSSSLIKGNYIINKNKKELI